MLINFDLELLLINFQLLTVLYVILLQFLQIDHNSKQILEAYLSHFACWETVDGLYEIAESGVFDLRREERVGNLEALERKQFCILNRVLDILSFGIVWFK